MTFTPDVYATGIGEVKEYNLKEIQAINLLARQLSERIDEVNGAQAAYRLRQNGTIKGSVIISLLAGNKIVYFREYTSESAYALGNNPTTTFTLNPAYSSDNISENTYYSIDELNAIFEAKNLKNRILTIDDNTYGNGNANNARIYLLSSGGTVRGSVVLALVGGDYYAEFQEYASEDAYKNNPYSPAHSVSITPGMPVAGIEAAREYTLDDLQKALDAAEAASRIPNVLKTEITDKKNDAYSGSGTMNDP